MWEGDLNIHNEEGNGRLSIRIDNLTELVNRRDTSQF